MNKKQSIVSLAMLLSILSGCVTAESLKKLPDEKLRYSSLHHPENLYRREIVNRHPDWPEKTKQAILSGKVFIGMPKEQARASWGEAYRVNRTTTQYGTHEQWVYGIYGHSFLYFVNDILTSIQN